MGCSNNNDDNHLMGFQLDLRKHMRPHSPTHSRLYKIGWISDKCNQISNTGEIFRKILEKRKGKWDQYKSMNLPERTWNKNHDSRPEQNFLTFNKLIPWSRLDCGLRLESNDIFRRLRITIALCTCELCLHFNWAWSLALPVGVFLKPISCGLNKSRTWIPRIAMQNL